ncbi:trypsin-like peptidase domain-containing protein [Streptomyces roseicoloratus]|uniref:VMAP-C domain-containing protein n=1 Tax=Streptomyces roseicoloratus TaxID=2508722 RepID=UPI001009C7F3|nr:trypsin-like peptidase domain-containing protein [Streptomyces roseicoloratus]
MSAFDALVRPALVRISAPEGGYDPHGDPFWGTGFFIAPGWVLTCAHVVAKGGSAVWREEPAVGITWEGGRTTGRVVLAKPRPATPDQELASWDFPDLALVRVDGAEHADCVRLSERPPTTPSRVSLHGWALQTGEPGVRDVEGEAFGAVGKALLVRDAVFIEGCSGGPVVDLGRGAVIGVIKGRGDGEGAVVPLTSLRELHDVSEAPVLHDALRAHDRHHRRRASRPGHSWTAAQTALWSPTARGVSPRRRAQLYGHFAELPPPDGPGEVMSLVDAVKRRVLHPDYQAVLETDARTWRDGVGRLHELPAGPGRLDGTDLGLDAVLLYAAHVARHVTDRYGEEAGPAGLTGLVDWIAGESGEAHPAVHEEITALLAPGPPPAAAVPARKAGARADVRVEVDPVPYSTPPRYAWRVMLLFDGRTVSPLSGDDTGVTRDRLRETLRGPLADALGLGDSGDHLAAVEAVLPRELFDEPLDTWRLSPDDEPFGERSLPLGQRRAVVVRDRYRSHHPPSPEWRRRWRGSESGPLRAVPLRAEVLTQGAEGHAPQLRRETRMAAFIRLDAAADGSVPVYCGPAGGGDGQRAMEAALAAGHPIALWRHSAREHTDCADFHKRAGMFLDGVRGAEGLHRPVRTLRRMRADDAEAGPEERSEHAWAEDLAVLYDPPDRPPYEVPLQGPPLLGEGER